MQLCLSFEAHRRSVVQ